ncbi:MAG: hypothetical protein ACTHK2_04535 [Dokdonella sp.]|uniref:hypothetical protein n=1 Tax=Dokdonella sp. TaxID=2291710 RepID=UPI003F7DD4EF
MLLVAVFLVLAGLILFAVGALAGADPDGRGARLMLKLWALSIVAIVAGVALFAWWWRSP